MFYTFFLSAKRSPTDQNSITYLYTAKKKLQKQNFTSALNSVNKEIRQYPKNPNLYFARGNLYFQEKIYRKALSNLLLAKKYKYNNQKELGLILAQIYDQNNDYVNLEKICTFLTTHFSKNKSIMSDVLWYYSKNFQTDKGIILGETVIQKWPKSASLHALLASLYAQSYDYKNAYALYKKAFSLSIDQENYKAASQILYNHARTEKQFYHFEEAENLIQMSLNMDNNPASYRFLAEFFLNMLSYDQVKNMIQMSKNFENFKVKHFGNLHTPLANLQLAELYLIFYDLDKAQKTLKDLDKYTNSSWMHSFTISKNQYLAWLYRLKKDLYKKKALILKRTLRSRFSISIFSAKLKMLFLYWYYDNLFHSWTLKTIHPFLHKKINLTIYQSALQITKRYPYVYKNFLKKASSLEINLSEKAKPSYMALQSLVNKNSQLRKEALQSLDPIYERFQQQNLLENWIQIEKRYKSQNSMILKLYELNPKATRPYGLPVVLKSLNKTPNQIIKKLKKILKINLRHIHNSPYSLELNLNSNTLSVVLKKNKFKVQSFKILINDNISKKEMLVLANQILDHLYSLQKD